MKNLLKLILLSAFIIAQDIGSNINSFNTNVVIRPANDNLEVITYIEIFNRNLQFIKVPPKKTLKKPNTSCSIWGIFVSF